MVFGELRRDSRVTTGDYMPFPSPGDLPDPGIEPGSAALQADSLPSDPLGKPTVKQLSSN